MTTCTRNKLWSSFPNFSPHLKALIVGRVSVTITTTDEEAIFPPALRHRVTDDRRQLPDLARFNYIKRY